MSSPCASSSSRSCSAWKTTTNSASNPLLTPLVGVGRVRAQVVAQVDMSVTEEAHEQYKPDSQIVRSEQTSEQVSRDGAAAQRRARRAEQPAAARGRRCSGRHRAAGQPAGAGERR